MIALRTSLFAACWLAAAGTLLSADAPPAPKVVPRMPPPGIAVPPAIQAELKAGVAALGREIAALQAKPAAQALLPDVQIYFNAVRYALEDDIFYRTNEFADARKLLAEGHERAQALAQGKAPWDTAAGLIVRGYRSRIDGSVQPYGILVPAGYDPKNGRAYRLDFWFHGRGANLSELSFITDRETKTGEFAPADTLVLHSYGRYCNANKFAGETDTFEAWDNAKTHYSIDANRVSVRGFSMGGAVAWHLAGHYASLWAAANPGAGFVDTAIFQKIYQRPRKTNPSWYEQRTWHLYDITDYAANLYNCPVVAYSGEIDGQKEAADLMAHAMELEGLELTHIIGANTAHKYEAKAKAEVARRMDALAAQGRDPLPKKVRFTTWTMRYNQQAWVTVDGLDKHWNRARVEAEIQSTNRVTLTTTNVTALTLAMPAGLAPFAIGTRPTVTIDGQDLTVPAVAKDRSWTAHFERLSQTWTPVTMSFPLELHKGHGLQGPIDDAFMDSFIMVHPTGVPFSAQFSAWAYARERAALREWRLQFRGEPRVKKDTEITAEDIANNNLILWGDPGCNRLLARIADRLPIQWDSRHIRLGPNTWSSATNAPVFIYPNPLNPQRYVVVNSGFTFADEAPTSNALQIPKLPDYALLDMTAQDAVTAAGFFDEQWQYSPLP